MGTFQLPTVIIWGLSLYCSVSQRSYMAAITVLRAHVMGKEGFSLRSGNPSRLLLADAANTRPDLKPFAPLLVWISRWNFFWITLSVYSLIWFRTIFEREYLTRGKICSISLFHGFCSALLSILWPDSILEQTLHHIYILLHIYHIVYIILHILEPALHHISFLTSPFGEQENRTTNDWTWDQDWISQCS